MSESITRRPALVIGASGLVGGALLRALGPKAIGTYRSRAVQGLRHLDVTDSPATERVLTELAPAIVYFPAAEPNVDWCETHPDEARAQNVDAAFGALRAARALGADFVFFSTDYVFDGAAGPYPEDAPVRPLSVYAKHKLEVEDRVLAVGGTVVRTTTVFGAEVPPGKNFVLRLVARLRAGEVATIPNDQLSTPTWSDELARAALAVGPRGGLWHVAGPDLLARDEFARLIADVYGLPLDLIRPVTTQELRQAASRPPRAGLRTDKLKRETGMTLMPTRSALVQLRDA